MLIHDKYNGDLDKNGYIEQSIDYSTLMKRHIRKHGSYLQPMYEAISNALEATHGAGDLITVRLRLQRLLNDSNEFLSMEIEDTGTGFDEENFGRLKRLYDESKDFNNRGTGRIQYLHYFDKTDIISIYEENGKKYERRIVLSYKFYKLNKSIIWASKPKEVSAGTDTGTSVAFFTLLDEEDKKNYSELNSEVIYNKVLIHYLDRFCVNRDNLQTIKIETYYGEVHDSSQDMTINKECIPTADYEEDFSLHYQLYDKDKKDFIDVKGKKEAFRISSYLLPSSLQSKNQIKLTSKNETVETKGFDFSFLEDSLRINDKYMLCLVSSNYFTINDTDERGELQLTTKSDFLKDYDAFEIRKPKIFIDNIQENVVSKVTEHYPEIKHAKEKYIEDIDKLIELFSLDKETVNKVGIKYGETKASFLRRYKAYDVEISSDNESRISQIYDTLITLDPSEPSFKAKLNRKASEISKLIPLQDKANVTKYIASRKVSLTILELILEKKLAVQHKKKKRQNKEQLLHDLIFRQGTTDTLNSNLWILNEDFIHYQGVSECELRNVVVNGEKFPREDLTEGEINKLTSYNKDHLAKRTDVLLFPEEHKCIIIELKSKEADVTKYLHQIVGYAGLIRQYAKEKFEITNFFGYLIGEDFDFDAVINDEPDFIKSPYLDYAYIPSKSVNGGIYRQKGTLYYEVLKYSSLLERATMRNSVFFDKIFGKSESNT